MLDALVLLCFLVLSMIQSPLNTVRQLFQVSQLFLRAPGTAPEEARLPIPPRQWYYPQFGLIVDTIENHVTKDRSNMKPGQNPMLYSLQEGFLPEDCTWMNHVREERMDRNATVLYRPEIVNNLVQRMEDLLATDERRGLMVKGPQGVGKSTSLINLTRYLLASQKYWVTLIPDCLKWEDEHDVFEFLLNSVGVDPALFKLDYEAPRRVDFDNLIADIDYILSKHGMQWVFVFDHVDEIFARKDVRPTNYIAALPFPFFLMDSVLNRGRIISIVCASANNAMWYEENQEGYGVFEHPTQWNNDEIKLMYPASAIAEWDWDEIEHLTGRVPLYLGRWTKDPKDYMDAVRSEIHLSLKRLKREKKDFVWKGFVESAIRCAVQEPFMDRPPLHWDRKYSLVQEVEKRGTYSYKVVALFPLVEEAYRDFFSDEISAKSSNEISAKSSKRSKLK